MSTRKHTDHPHLTGEHRLGDTGQLILLLIFIVIYITDTFIYQYSTFLDPKVPNYIQVPLAILIWAAGATLAYRGMRMVFGSKNRSPGVISSGVFSIVRHPIYLGAILFYLGMVVISLSIASAALFVIIVAFYISIARYEEKILTREFGDAYIQYRQRTGMLFPKLTRRKQ